MIRKEEKVRMINKNLRKILGLTLSAVVAVGSFNVMPGCKKQVMTAKAANENTLADKREYKDRKVVNVDSIARVNDANKVQEGSEELNTSKRSYLWGTFNVNGKKDKYVYKSSSPQEVVTFTVGNTQWKGVLTRIAYGIDGRNYPNSNEYYYVDSIVGVEPVGDLKSSVITLPSTISVSTKAGEQVKATCVELAPYAFAGKNITKVNIPDTYQRICDGAFADCTELQSVQIVTLKNDGITIDKVGDGSSLHTLGSYAFAGCSSLKTPYLPDSLIKLGEIANSKPQQGDSVCVPNTGKSPYENERGETGFNKYYMGTGVFQDCYGIERVELGNDKLKEVYVPEDTFAGCTSLAYLKIDSNVTKLVIGKSAFAGSEGGAGNKLNKLEFNCDVILDSFAFTNCNNLTTVKFNKGFNNPDLMGYDTSNLDNHDNVYHRYSKLYAHTGNFYGIFKDSFKENEPNTGIDISPCDTKEGKKIIIPNGFLEGSNISKVSITGTTGGVDEASLEIDKYAFKNTVLDSFEIKVNNLKLDNHSLYGINTATLKLSASGKIETVGEVFADTYNKPVSENNINIKKIIFDAPVVDFGYGTISNWQMKEPFGTSSTFYGVGDNAVLVFGSNTDKVDGFHCGNHVIKYKNNTVETSALHKPLGDIKEVYVGGKNTKIGKDILQDMSGKDACDKYKYTLYGYNGVPVLENGQETQTSYSDVAKKAENITFKEYVVGLTVEQKKPIVITSFQKEELDDYLDVRIQFRDNTDEKLKYDAKGIDGYCLNQEFFDKIKEYRKDPKKVSETVTFEYAGMKTTADIQLVPKDIVSFRVEPKKDKIFVAGTKVTPQDFDISQVRYNDGEEASKLTGRETITAHCVVGDTLKEGINTICVRVNEADGFVVVNAVPKAIVRLSAKQTNKEKFEGEKLENSDFEVTAYYNDGEETKDFKDFEILTKDALTTDTKSATIALKENDKVSTEVALADVKKLAPQYLNASYTGAGVMEGQEVKKSDIKVEVFYSNNTSRVLKEDEYDLAYGKIVGGIENAVTIVYKADTTKKYVITVTGLKSTANGTTPKPSKTPAGSTATPKPSKAPVGSTATPKPSKTPGSNTTTAVPTVTPDTSKIPTVDTTTTPVATNADGNIATSTPAPTAPATEVPVPTAEVPNAQPILGKTKTAKVTLGSGEKITVKAASELQSYKTANREIAAISAKGIITAKKTGKTVITVTDKNNNTLKVTVTVKKAPKKVSVNFAKKTLKVKKKATIKVKFAKGYYSNKLTFTSSNKKIATVNAKGVITAKKKGTCKITIKTYNGKKTVVKITVK